MDFSILYRVIWQPSAVFKQFEKKTRLEPFVLISVIVVFAEINAYAGRFEEIIKHPVLMIMGFLQGFLLSLLFPAVDATIVFLIARFVLKERSSFVSLVSAFVLCELPYYLEGILITAFGFPSVGVGSLITAFRTLHPFLFGILAVITPFFIWMIFLWWAAINQMFNLKHKQNIFLVGSLIVTSTLLSGLWSQLKCTLVK